MNEAFDKLYRELSKDASDSDAKYYKPLAELVFEAATPQWQPIETAPNDGSRIILGSTKGWVVESEWFSSCWLCEADGQALLEPTHWQPLPEPPKP